MVNLSLIPLYFQWPKLYLPMVPGMCLSLTFTRCLACIDQIIARTGSYKEILHLRIYLDTNWQAVRIRFGLAVLGAGLLTMLSQYSFTYVLMTSWTSPMWPYFRKAPHFMM